MVRRPRGRCTSATPRDRRRRQIPCDTLASGAAGLLEARPGQRRGKLQHVPDSVLHSFLHSMPTRSSTRTPLDAPLDAPLDPPLVAILYCCDLLLRPALIASGDHSHVLTTTLSYCPPFSSYRVHNTPCVYGNSEHESCNARNECYVLHRHERKFSVS